MSNLQSLEQRMDRVDYHIISDDKDKKIADLEAKLAESEEFTQGYRKECAKIQSENVQLKQQLAEKDEEMERLNLEFETQEDWQEKWQKLYDETCNLNQDKISFCIEQLEKVKEKVEKRNNGTKHGHCSVEYKDGYSGCCCQIIDFIDDQIKQLKEIE